MTRFFKPLEAIQCFIICAVLLLLVFNVPVVQAQIRIHDLGKFKLEHTVRENTNTNDLTQGTGNWPQEVYWSGNFNFQYFGRYVESWWDADPDLPSLHEKTSHGGTSFRNEGGFLITEHRRFAPPVVNVFADGVWRVDSPIFEEVVDPNIPSDMMVVNKTKFSPGLWAKVKSYTLSNQNHDDYAIYEVTYTFTGDNDDDPELEVDTDYGLKGVYFVFAWNMADIQGTWIAHSRWYASTEDDWTNWETYTSTLVPGARPLEIVYEWDGDDQNSVNEFEPGGPPFDDTGDPRFGIGEGGNTSLPSGEFTSSNYNGYAVLHADVSATDKSDDISQPYSIITSVNVQAVWGNIFGGGLYPTVFDWANSGTRTDWTTTPGYPDDPEVLIGDMPHSAVGPYDMALGDSITIVVVIASGGISRDLQIEKGLEWRDWYRGVPGATFDDAAKNALLATGKDSLFQTIDRALWAWNRGMDVPDPLPAPSLDVISGPNRNDLKWEDMSDVGDPDTGVPDLDHYNVYRKKGSYLEDTDEELREDGMHERWQFLTSVPATQTTYSDEDVIRGEAYHYAVTAVDDGTQNTDGLFPGQKLESSLYKNRNFIPVKPFEPGADNTENVFIVPNPFISGAGDFNFTGTRSNVILFVNLPPYCTLSIYTVTGDLIKKIEHTDGSADAEWDLITESNQYVASGVYLLRISNASFLDGSKLPDTIEKFVVVR